MSPVTVGALLLAGVFYVVLTWLNEREQAAARREIERLKGERWRHLAEQAVFNRRLDELRAREDAEEEDEIESGCQGGHPAPQPIGLQILGETDAAIAEELIRQTAHLPRRSQA